MHGVYQSIYDGLSEMQERGSSARFLSLGVEGMIDDSDDFVEAIIAGAKLQQVARKRAATVKITQAKARRDWLEDRVIRLERQNAELRSMNEALRTQLNGDGTEKCTGATLPSDLDGASPSDVSSTSVTNRTGGHDPDCRVLLGLSCPCPIY